jgi:hypothetical protein
MSLIRRLSITLLIFQLIGVPLVHASGAVAQGMPGQSCRREGQTMKSTRGFMRCTKTDRGLVWRLTKSSSGNSGASVATTTTVASQCAVGGVCRVGDTGPGGGVVFYANESGFACGPTATATCRYLESAPTSGPNAWSDAALPWSQSGIDIGARGTAIGTGYRNTVVAFAALGGSVSGSAISASREYRGPNNRDDWYLPSRDEAYQLYVSRSILGGFAVSGYWTSTEIDRKRAWVQNFNDTGNQRELSRPDTSIRVRPIRSFNVAGAPNNVVSPCASGGQCFVGDVGPGGGDVFYADEAGFLCGPTLSATCRYLESAPTSGANAWSDVSLVFSTAKLCPPHQPGERFDHNYGRGYSNTVRIVTSDSSLDRAAGATRAYRGPNNKDDWFLPSHLELLSFAARNPNPVQVTRYWSSSFSSLTCSFPTVFTSLDNSRGRALTETAFVRPVRSF